jgi:hypothetical protein
MVHTRTGDERRSRAGSLQKESSPTAATCSTTAGTNRLIVG